MISKHTLAIILVVVFVVAGIIIWLYEELRDKSPKVIEKKERTPHNRSDLVKALQLGMVGQPLIFYEKSLSNKQLQKDPYREDYKNRTYSVSCESRGIVFGVSGSGKTNFILAQIIDWMRSGKSFVVTDIKPEIWGILQTNGLFEHFGYDDIVINPTDPKSTPYNMLNDISKDSDLDELLSVLIPASSEELQAFAVYGRLVFKAIIYHLQDTKNDDSEPVSLAHAHDFLTSTPQFDKIIYDLQKSTPRVQKLINQAQLSANNERFVSSAINALTTALRAFNDEVVLNNQKGGLSLSMTLLEPRKAIFLQFEQSTQSLTENLYSSTIQNLINLLMSNYQRRDDILLLLDELLNGGKIDNLPLKFNLIRSYKMPTFLYVQGMENFKNRYGLGGANEIISACNVRICYRTNDQVTAEYFSKESGEITVTRHEQTIQQNGENNRMSVSARQSKELLLSADDMNNLDNGEALCVCNGKSAVVKMPIHHKDTLANKRAEYIRPSDIY